MARTLKRWKQLAWQELSRYKRSLGYCQRCGVKKDPKQLNAHHLITKSHGNYAYFEEDNIIAICVGCHRYIHGHATWDEERDLIEKVVGLDRYWELKREAVKTCKYSITDYEDMIERWEGMQE